MATLISNTFEVLIMVKRWCFVFFFCLFQLNNLIVFARSVEGLLEQAGQYYRQNDYALAQQKYLEAFKLSETEHNVDAQTRSALSLAKCYYFLYDHPASFNWSYSASAMAKESNNDTLLSQAYYFLGALYIEEEQVDSAEKYSTRAIGLMQKLNDFAHLSQTYSTLAELYLNTSKDRLKIEKMISKANEYAELSKDPGMSAFAASKQYNYAFFIKKDYREALDFINKAEKLYRLTGNREAIMNAYRGKAECLVMLRDTTARKYMLQWFQFKDSVLQSEKAINLAKFEALYEINKKESENRSLQKKNEQNRLVLFIVLFAFLLFLVLALWLINRSRLKKKESELLMLQNLQKDKERIARDLHDNVGGQLSYIIYSLDGINDEDKEKRREITRSITQAVRSVISNLRETIWAISDANIGLQDFSDKLKVFVRDLFKYSQTKVNFSENLSSNRELNALLGLNLYRICQEILTNSFKYAGATEVKIDVEETEEKLLITMSDNGIGFDITRENKEQYGLQNIRKRAAEFGISVTLETEMSKGTKYVLLV